MNVLITTLLLSAATAAQGMDAAAEAPRTAPWTAAHVEHLFNRAGFGLRDAEAEALAALGREAVVERLLQPAAARGEYFVANVMQSDRAAEDAMGEQERKDSRRARRKRDDAQLADFAAFWVEQMLAGDDPLREKMTLYWHGHFASSQRTVKDSYAMIRQNQLFHAHALGSFRDLAHGIVRDAAMIKYLDNDDNRKGKPNENLARELMELFTLGEGSYSEADVKEAARALTGWSARGGEFAKLKKHHDKGEKTVLGVSGPLDADALVDVLLAQEACGVHLAGDLIAFFEGTPPTAERVADYARLLVETDYDLAAFLRRLFNDPAFYREEVLGSRIPAPLEHLVATARRLGVDPPARLLLASSKALGQTLFHPPSVKGWDEGEAWITTSSLMLRANLAGVLLGVVSIDDIVSLDGGAPPSSSDAPREWDDEDAMSADAATSMEAAAPKQPKRRLGDLQDLKALRSSKWRPRLSLTARLAADKARGDGKMVDALVADLLAVPVGPETRKYLVRELRARRAAHDVENGKLLDHPELAEQVLRELAHVLLSLPEAQLH